MKKYKEVPSFDELIEPCFNALKQLGGSGTVDEIYDKVVKDLKLTDSALSVMQVEGGCQTKVAYNLAWARTYLKKYGAINNSSRSVWEIKNEYKNKQIRREEVVAFKTQWGEDKKDSFAESKGSKNYVNKIEEIPEENKPWIEEIMQVLTLMDPYAFERLTQFILRKLGLDQVNVTKKSNDGEIDGYGVFKLHDVISFNIAFQCKRYQGSVGSKEIRDFRGSLSTDIEKALFVTTGTFTQDAKNEARAQGKLKIDLIDGDDLVAKIIDLGIGVKEEKTYVVDKSFFLNF